MRWDYKEAACANGVAVGIAAICETLPDLLERSGGVEQLQRDMAEAAEARGGLGLLLALTKEDEAAGGAKALVALLPPQGGAAKEATMAASILEQISGSLSLPETLESNPLFQAQRVPDEGFGVCWEERAAGSRLRFSTLRRLATRKTLMPAVVHFGGAASDEGSI
eukprot:838360-Prymnesium_polylepis.1